jgi:hypothetical protein
LVGKANKRPHPKVQNAQRKNQETYDLNPSLIAQSKSCKEMGEQHKKTPSLEEACPATIIVSHKIVVA